MPEEFPARRTLLTYLDDYARLRSSILVAHHRGLRTFRWSYERLALESRRFARELEARGIQRGERVLVCGENSPEWIVAFWGCCLRGAVVVPLDKGSTPEFVASVVEQTQAKLILADRESHAASRLKNPILRLEDLSEQIARYPNTPYSVEDIDADTVVEIVYTSGTTAEPKGVVLTHRNLLANLVPLEAEIKKYMKWERLFHPIRFLNLVPLSHVFGQFMGLFVPPLLSGEIHFHQSLNPSEIVRVTRTNRISVIVLVPRVLDALREWVERDYAARDQTERLREQIVAMEGKNFLRRWWSFRRLHKRFGWKFWAFVSGGATLAERTENFWRRLGFAALQGYGMTEAAALISVNHPFKRSSGSIGRLMPGYEIKLDESGEIMVRGASVSPGYWTAGGIKSRANQWLHTGDIGEMDASGNLFFKGRHKDVIVGEAGLNIYPEDLEAALDRQPEVRASCVIPIEGAHGSEPLAVIILHEHEANAEAAIKRANAQLAEYQQIRRWSIWTEPDFPRNATHKVLKREVGARINAENRSDAAATSLYLPSDSTNLAANVLASEIARITGDLPAKLDSSAQLADLQLDSLGRVELLSALEDRYQISLDEASFTGATTLGEVEKVVRGEIADLVGVPYPYPEWARWRFVRGIRILLFYTIILPITRLMSRMSVEGRNHLDSLSEPVLFVANHVTVADHALVLAGLPARLRHHLAIAMEGELLRNWLHPPVGTNLPTRLRWLAQYVLVNLFFHVFPLPKQSGFRQSFAYAGDCVDRAESLLVFPEGTRAPRGQMRMSSFKAGIGVLAQALSIPVVPVIVDGLYELKRRKQYFAPTGMVRVIFGEPVIFGSDADPMKIAQELERRVVSLL
jgi:long-chain acyl-CoA synthetase